MKPSIPDAVGRFAEYYRIHPSWGSLHIVLDDDNVANKDVEWCIGWAEEHGDAEGAELARILLTMSRTQRLKMADAAREHHLAAFGKGRT